MNEVRNKNEKGRRGVKGVSMSVKDEQGEKRSGKESKKIK